MAKDIYELLAQQFGGPTETIENPDLATLANNTAEMMLRQDPRRVAWSFINLGAATVFIRPSRAPATTAGIAVAPGGSVSVTARDDFALPALEWWAISPSGAQSYSVFATRLTPDDAVSA